MFKLKCWAIGLKVWVGNLHHRWVYRSLQPWCWSCGTYHHPSSDHSKGVGS